MTVFHTHEVIMRFTAYYYCSRLGNIQVYFTAPTIDFDRTKRYLCYEPTTTKEFNILGADLSRVRVVNQEVGSV
jgi:hypothetical protein